jgi:5-formyltetrahydrofolate cyclo-ligase
MSDEHKHLTHHPSLITHHSLERSQLRRAMRAKRTILSVTARILAARMAVRHVRSARLLHRGQRIGVYNAFDGEIDLTALILYANSIGCALYAPIITSMSARKMEFAEFNVAKGIRKLTPHDVRVGNGQRFAFGRRINPRFLDVVFVPVVAFDDKGWRLGFGAGFYDRKFAFMHRRYRNKPLLVGVAYEFQRLPEQKPGPWDVLLDAVVTERGIHRFTKRPMTFD